MRQGNIPEGTLKDRTETRVRFSEVDALGIVWHGHFLRYLEDGRESFGMRYGLGYSEVYDQGLTIPVVGLEISYKTSVAYGDSVVIDTAYVPCEAAKIIFSYKVFRKSDMELVLEATTTQVFLNRDGELELTSPAFYSNWKEKHRVTGRGGA